MKLRSLPVILLCTGCSLQTGAPSLALSGPWQVSYDGRSWQSVTLPSNLAELRPASISNRIVLRRSVSIDTEAMGRETTGWRSGVISDRARLFLNGRCIWPPDDEERAGPAARQGPESYDRNVVVALPDRLIRPDRNELRIELHPFFEHEFGLLRGDPTVGSLHLLQEEKTVQEAGALLLATIFLVLSLYYLLLFARHRQEASALPLGIFLMLLGFYLLHRTDLKYTIGIGLLALKRAEYMSLMLLLPPLTIFFRVSLGSDNRPFSHFERVATGLITITLCLAALWMATGDDLRRWDAFNTSIVQRYLWPVLFLCMAIRLGIALHQGRRNARFLLVGTIVAFIGVTSDILTHQGWFTLPPAAPLSLLAFVGGLALSQIDQSIQLRRDLAELNGDLERRVADRTEQYRQSLEEIQGLKEQQDADYYLTSLVLRPLSHRNGEDVYRRLHCASLIRQKKRFAYRERHGELGGDINIIETIRLRGREHLAFLNADAMGKSIQGAGGAVVLGTVFGACLNRNEQLPEISSLFPEEWLRRSYEELQSVFCSFDGSMMASAVMGLIDAEAGCLYHWNAEHPSLVLFREGSARMLATPGMLHRLGTTLPGQELRIHVMPLQTGDRVYAGTDGRDDLLLGDPPSMNQSPERFLRCVEQAEHTKTDQPILERLFDLLCHGATITDDIALMRFEFQGRTTRLLPRLLRSRAAELLEQRLWHESLPALESYIEANPADEQTLRVGFRIARRLGHPLAERWNRRLRLREREQ